MPVRIPTENQRTKASIQNASFPGRMPHLSSVRGTVVSARCCSRLHDCSLSIALHPPSENEKRYSGFITITLRSAVRYQLTTESVRYFR